MNMRVLIIEDDEDGRRSVEEAVREAGFEAVSEAGGKSGVARFEREGADVVLTDLVLPDIDGLQVMERIRARDPQTPVLIMTAHGSMDSSIKALRLGAYDYLIKPLDFDELQTKLGRAAETLGLRRTVRDLNETLHGRYSARAMVAVSPGMREVVRQIEALATTKATVLIRGESGVGKELVARALHYDSSRAAGPFIAVNCGAFSESLLESELFGHEKGAFTGATAQHKGAFERADGGTLFLDEVGDAPKAVQVKLLRVLEEREIMRVGGQKVLPVDVRIVSASHRDLEEMVEEGSFRQDLLFRLNVVSLAVPPLRERREDIRPLAERFLAQACEEHGRGGFEVKPDFYTSLERQDWPGNVRQLRNTVEAAVIMARGRVLDASSCPSPASGRETPAGGQALLSDMTLEEIEREALIRVLRENEGNRSIAAEKLGISRRTIQRKIKEHNLPF